MFISDMRRQVAERRGGFLGSEGRGVRDGSFEGDGSRTRDELLRIAMLFKKLTLSNGGT